MDMLLDYRNMLSSSACGAHCLERRKRVDINALDKVKDTCKPDISHFFIQMCPGNSGFKSSSRKTEHPCGPPCGAHLD